MSTYAYPQSDIEQIQANVLAYLESVPKREGDRPITEGPAPHRQLTQYPKTKEYKMRLHEHMSQHERSVEGHTHIGDGGLHAILTTIQLVKQTHFCCSFLQ